MTANLPVETSYLANTGAVDIPGVLLSTLSESDPFGFIMAVIGMGIVFSALLLMYAIFSNTPVLYTSAFRQKAREWIISVFKKRDSGKQQLELATQESTELSGEVNAAIAAAIHLYASELHDFEDTVLTIKKVSRTYSPWSSKIYGVRNNLNKN